MEKNKVWLWRAFDPVARRTLAWELGGRDDATCRRLLDRVGVDGNVFLTDDWEGFHRLIPQDRLFTGKDLTFPIEQDNSDVTHNLQRPPPPPRAPATWSTAPSSCSATCDGPRTSCPCATASYLSSVKCLLMRSTQNSPTLAFLAVPGMSQKRADSGYVPR